MGEKGFCDSGNITVLGHGIVFYVGAAPLHPSFNTFKANMGHLPEELNKRNNNCLQNSSPKF